MEELYYPPRNFGSLPAEYASLESSRVVVLPVPYDSTTSYRSGARDGPRAILDASGYLEMYDIELKKDICEVGIHTLPELQPVMRGPEAMIERVYQVMKGHGVADKLMVMLGGEHSLTLGAVRALKERHRDLSVLQLDAHADLRDEYMGTKYGHASVMRRVWECCPIVQVGLRSLCREEWDFMEAQGLKPVYASELMEEEKSYLPAIAALSQHVYITVDLDVFDPSVLPAVGTPEPGGLNWYQVMRVLKEVALRKRIVGIDVMELCPQEGSTASAFLAAKLAYKLMGYALLLPGAGVESKP